MWFIDVLVAVIVRNIDNVVLCCYARSGCNTNTSCSPWAGHTNSTSAVATQRQRLRTAATRCHAATQGGHPAASHATKTARGSWPNPGTTGSHANKERTQHEERTNTYTKEGTYTNQTWTYTDQTWAYATYQFALQLFCFTFAWWIYDWFSSELVVDDIFEIHFGYVLCFSVLGNWGHWDASPHLLEEILVWAGKQLPEMIPHLPGTKNSDIVVAGRWYLPMWLSHSLDVPFVSSCLVFLT